MYSQIVGIGSYAPYKRLSNQDISKMVDTNDEWITNRTGIKYRRIAKENEFNSDLATKAALKACESADISPESFDLIICGTTSPDRWLPATACIIQKKLGAKKAVAFDVQAACSGFIYGLNMADLYVRSGQFSRILVVGSEKLSSFVNYEDRNTCILFGDGAGAAIVMPSKRPGIISTHIKSAGEHWEMLNIPYGGSENPIRPSNIGDRHHFIEMNGKEIFKQAVSALSEVTLEMIENNNLDKDQIDHIVPHQANIRIIEAFAKRAEIPMDKFIVNIDQYGNTSSATIPLALDEAYRDGRLKKGDKILMAAFGAGITSGAALLNWRI